MSSTEQEAMQIQLELDDIADIPVIAGTSHYGAINAPYDEEREMAESKTSFSFRDVFKEISGIAIPMSLSFAFSFEVFLAVLLLQRLSESEEDTAAASLVSVMMNTVCALALSPLFIISNDLSKQLGRWQENKRILDENAAITEAYDLDREKERIESVNLNSFLVGSALTLPPILTFYYSSSILSTIFNQNSDVAHSAQEFLRPFACAIPALMLKINLEQIMFSFGKTRPAMWMGLTSLSIGTSLAILFGFGIKIGSLQFPKMNQKGIALGFVLENYLSALAYGLFVKFGRECSQFDFYSISIQKIRRNLNGVMEILRKGGANTFTMTIELALTLSVVIFSGLLGTTQQAAMSYCMQFIYFEFIMIAAFSFSCAQELSRKLGAEQFKDAQKIARYGLLTSLIYLAPLPLLFIVYPKALEVLSGGVSEEVANILPTLAPIMSAGVILDTIRFNLLQQCRSLDDLVIPSIIALLGMSSGIGLAASLGFETALGIYGIGAGYTFGIGATAVALGLRWKPKIAKLVVVDAENNTSLEPETPVKRSLWGSVSSFFCSERNSLAIQAERDITEYNGYEHI